MIVTTSYFNNLVLTSLTEKINSGGYTGPLNGLSLMLFSNNLILGPTTTYAQLTEAPYSGYARVTGLTWNSPLLQADGSYTILSQLSQFAAVGASNFTAANVYGWALIDTSSTPNLIMAELLPTPVPFAAPGDGFGLVIEWNFGPPNPASFGSVLA